MLQKRFVLFFVTNQISFSSSVNISSTYTAVTLNPALGIQFNKLKRHFHFYLGTCVLSASKLTKFNINNEENYQVNSNC